jgi:hypothetical protein
MMHTFHSEFQDETEGREFCLQVFHAMPETRKTKSIHYHISNVRVPELNGLWGFLLFSAVFSISAGFPWTARMAEKPSPADFFGGSDVPEHLV